MRSGVLRNILRFGAVQVTATLVANICQLVFVILLARWYANSVVGAYGIALAYYALFSLLSGAGLTAVIYRETAANLEEGKRLFHLTVSWRLRLAVLLLVGAIPVMVLSGGSMVTFLFVLLGGCTNYVSDPALSYLGGRLRFVLVGLVSVVQRAVPIAILVIFSAWDSPALPGLAYLVGAASTSFYILWAARLNCRRLSLDMPSVVKVLRVSWPLAAASLGDAVALRISTLLLGLFRGAGAAGAYTPIASVAYGAASLAYAGFQPLIAVLGDRSEVAIPARIVRATAFLFGGLVVAGVLGQAVTDSAYRVLFDRAPTGETSLAMRILIVGLVPWIMAVWFTIHMQLLRDYRATMWPSAIGAASLVVLGIPLIIRHGIVGAAATSLFGDTIRMIWGARWLLRTRTAARP